MLTPAKLVPKPGVDGLALVLKAGFRVFLSKVRLFMAGCGLSKFSFRNEHSNNVFAGADETLRFWRVFGEPPLAKDDKAGAAGAGLLAGGAPLGGLRSIR